MLKFRSKTGHFNFRLRCKSEIHSWETLFLHIYITSQHNTEEENKYVFLIISPFSFISCGKRFVQCKPSIVNLRRSSEELICCT